MDCRVCGRQFDPLGFQVTVPGLEHGFDRVDCALEAGALRPPASRSAEPLPPVVRALPAVVAPVPVPAPAVGSGPVAKAESVRPQLLGGANLALLAVGTAAVIYLWLRVFGADAGPFSFLAERASQAFGRTTVPAAIDLTHATEIRPEVESTVGGGETSPAVAGPTAAVSGHGGTLVSNPSPRKEPRERGPGGPIARPAPPPPPSEPPSEPGPTRSAPAPTFPVPSSPPGDRVPGPTLPTGPNPEQPALPGGGRD